MRVIAAAGAALLVTLAGTGASHARYEGPWCVHTNVGHDFIESRCDMRTYEQCRAEMWGLSSAYCTENPRFPGYEPQRLRKPKRRAPR